MNPLLLILLLLPFFASAQTIRKVPSASTAKGPTITAKSSPQADLALPSVQNNLRFFPFNLLESAIHVGYERQIRSHIAGGVEGLKTLGSARPSFASNAEFEETYFGGYGQYFLKPSMDGFFVEGGLNFVQAKLSANVGIGGSSEKVSKNESYVMPHLTANWRLRTVSGLSATFGGGLTSYLGGGDLKIEETRKGFTNSGYEEKSVKIETPYKSGLGLRARLDIGYSF